MFAKNIFGGHLESIICKTITCACVCATRVARWPLASLRTPSPYIHRGVGVRGARGYAEENVIFLTLALYMIRAPIILIQSAKQVQQQFHQIIHSRLCCQYKVHNRHLQSLCLYPSIRMAWL